MIRIIGFIIIASQWTNATFAQLEVSIEEQLIQTTSLILGLDSKTEKWKTGTGFFYIDNELAPGSIFLVTNKHVVKDKKEGILSFNSIDRNKKIYGNEQKARIVNFENEWIGHPDTTVDLCYMNINPIINAFKSKGIEIFTRTLSPDLIPSDSVWSTMSVLEEVIMIGYPNGISDKTNNIPIIRTGITATPPKLNYNNKKEFLIDIAAFPGSSGSPIIVKRTPWKVKENSFGVYPEYYFVGVLYAGPTYSPEIKELEFLRIDELADSLNLKTDIMINLGNVIKSSEITYMIRTTKK